MRAIKTIFIAVLTTGLLAGSALLAAAQDGTVDHIIVQQGRSVDKLDDTGQADVGVTLVAGEPGAEQQHHRAHTLAAAGQHVFADLADQRHP